MAIFGGMVYGAVIRRAKKRLPFNRVSFITVHGSGWQLFSADQVADFIEEELNAEKKLHLPE